jgi:hypothetical protein
LDETSAMLRTIGLIIRWAVWIGLGVIVVGTIGFIVLALFTKSGY